MSATAASRMSRVDTAWLRMDSDVNLMMIVGVWLLEPAITIDALRARVADKLLKYERFRCKVVVDALGASWVDDEDFDLGRHVVAEALPSRPGSSARSRLQQSCGELATQRLDPDHPLWQLHLIERYDGGSALIARIHHCIGDGIALMSVMLSITDGGSEPPTPERAAAGEGDDGDDGDGAGAGDVFGQAGTADALGDAMLRRLADAVVKTIGASGDGVAKALALLASRDGVRGVAGAGLRALKDVAALALMPDDSPTLLKGRPEGRKLVAWGEPIPLDRVKAVGKALGCSVNDVLLACVAGAIGASLRQRGDEPEGKAIRAMVPVNLRPLDEAWKLGNRFGLAPLTLPIGIDNPVERVYEVHSRMSELKGSYQPLLAFAVLAAAGLVNKPAQDALLGLFARKSTAVMTNVPGPAERLRFCGATLRQTMFWVPASGDIGLGVSILSYGGGVQFGLIADRRLCPDPQSVVDGFEPEFDRLVWLALMLPWAGASTTAAG
jgi:WS/DGAT/MGAT family acyltransferase